MCKSNVPLRPPLTGDVTATRFVDMEIQEIARTDLKVSRIAYGCAGLAPWDHEPVNDLTVTKAEQLIRTAHDLGITLFDHADIYAFGNAEIVFGKVLQRSPGLRHKIVIQSKCGQVIPRDWRAGRPLGVDLRENHITGAVEGSLQRLGTDYLDILLLHTPDPLMNDVEIARAFSGLKRSGKVRHFGVSNFSAAQIERLGRHLEQPLVVNQINVGLGAIGPITDGMEFPLSLLAGRPAKAAPLCCAALGTLDYCRLRDIHIQAWSPLAGALRLKSIAKLLEVLAAERNATPSSIALAWLLQHPAEICPVIGPSQVRHLEEDCSADRITLTRKQWLSLLSAAATSSCDVEFLKPVC